MKKAGVDLNAYYLMKKGLYPLTSSWIEGEDKVLKLNEEILCFDDSEEPTIQIIAKVKNIETKINSYKEEVIIYYLEEIRWVE